MLKSAARLIPIAQLAQPFTSEGRTYLHLPNGNPAVFPVRSRAFRNWFFYEFFARYDSLPGPYDCAAIAHLCEARASVDPRNQNLAVFLRVGSRGPAALPRHILLDLANPDSQCIDITPAGWSLTSSPGTLLESSRSAREILAPVPAAPAAIDTLRSVLNLPDRASWLRCLAWLLAAFRPAGPFPFLLLQGPPASGKSFAARVLRSFVDPAISTFAPAPSHPRDLLPVARHHWILAFDHVSALSPALADAFCRLTAGLGAVLPESPRRDPEPLLHSLRRPVLLTATCSFRCPTEIAERSLVVTLPPLPPENRLPEAALIAALTPAWPAILGALCSAVSTALARLPETAVPTARCADALAWAIAASPALGCTEDELRQAFAPPPPPHPIVQAVRALIDQRRRWTGTATDLLDLLQPALSCSGPEAISKHLRSCSVTLAESGIELKFRRLHGGDRIIEMSQEPGDSSATPQLSPDTDPPAQSTEKKDLTK